MAGDLYQMSSAGAVFRAGGVCRVASRGGPPCTRGTVAGLCFMRGQNPSGVLGKPPLSTGLPWHHAPGLGGGGPGFCAAGAAPFATGRLSRGAPSGRGWPPPPKGGGFSSLRSGPGMLGHRLAGEAVGGERDGYRHRGGVMALWRAAPCLRGYGRDADDGGECECGNYGFLHVFLLGGWFCLRWFRFAVPGFVSSGTTTSPGARSLRAPSARDFPAMAPSAASGALKRQSGMWREGAGRSLTRCPCRWIFPARLRRLSAGTP